jgi:hypothetical protein
LREKHRGLHRKRKERKIQRGKPRERERERKIPELETKIV